MARSFAVFFLAIAAAACGDRQTGISRLQGEWGCDPRLTWEKRMPGKAFPSDAEQDPMVRMCRSLTIAFDTRNNTVAVRSSMNERLDWSGRYTAVTAANGKIGLDVNGVLEIFELGRNHSLVTYPENDISQALVFSKK